MIAPTQAQIEAATQALMKELDRRGDTQTSDEAYREIAMIALATAAEADEKPEFGFGPPETAAAEEGEQIKTVSWPKVRNLLIERCAQVAENHWIPGPPSNIGKEIAAAIRALKEDH